MQQNLTARVRSSVLLALAGSAVGLFAGCDDRSEHARSIEKASQDLVSMTGGGTYSAPADARKKGLDAAANTVKDAANDGDDGVKAPASVLTASTLDGLALAPAEEARRLDRESRNTITRLNSMLSEWVIWKATAAAAESFDPSAQIGDLRASKAERAARVATEKSRLAELETGHAALLAAAAVKATAATEAQAGYVEQMAGITKLSAVAAAPVVDQANRVRREGDIARLAGARIEAEAAELAPLISELKLVIAQLENQNKNLDATVAELNARAAAYRTEASDASAAANAAANDLDAMAGTLKELHEGPLAAAFAEAQSLLRKAAENAGKGGTASPASGKLAAANARAALADVEWTRAMSAASFAGVMELLAGVEPKLPQAPSYATDAATARGEQTEALTAASEAFEAARSAVAGVRVQGAAKERLERLSELLEKSRTVTSGEAADVNATFNLKARTSPVTVTGAGGGAGASKTPEAAPTADSAMAVDAELIAMLDEMDAKSKSGEDISSYMISSNPAMISAMTTTEGLRAAAQKAYGKDLTELLADSPIAASLDTGWSSKDFVITMKDANLATSTLAGAPIPIAFKKIDGAWKVDLDAMGPMAAMMLLPIGKALGDFTKEVEAGDVPEAEFAAELMRKIQGAMPGMPGDK